MEHAVHMREVVRDARPLAIRRQAEDFLQLLLIGIKVADLVIGGIALDEDIDPAVQRAQLRQVDMAEVVHLAPVMLLPRQPFLLDGENHARSFHQAEAGVLCPVHAKYPRCITHLLFSSVRVASGHGNLENCKGR